MRTGNWELTESMKRTSLILLLLFLYLLAAGQIPFNVKQKKIDSLFVRLKTARDTAYVNTLNNLSLNLTDRNFDSAYRYAQQALAWARHYHYPKGEGVAYLNTGNCYFIMMDLKAALNQYFKGQRILEPLGPSMDLENLYFQMGYINCLVPNNERTLDFFIKVLETSQVIGDSIWGGVGACYELSWYYYQCLITSENPDTIQFLDKIQKYVNRAFELSPYDTIMNLDGLIDCLTIKGLLHGSKGKNEDCEPFNQALHFALKMQQTNAFSPLFLEVFDTAGTIYYLGFCYLNLGGCYLSVLHDLKRGEECNKKSLDVLKNNPHIEIKASALANLGYICRKQKKYDKAIQYYRESLAYSDTFLTCSDRQKHLPSWTRLRTISNIKANKVDVLKALAKIHKATGAYQKALEYQQLAEEANNKLKMDDFDNQLNLLQSNFENERNTSQMASLASQNELQRIKLFRTRILLFGLGTFAMVLVLAVIFYFQRNKLRISQKALILEQKLLRSQMNPHFLFNSLSSIQNFIVTEKPDKASIYLSKFAMLVRNILDNSMEEFVVLEKEISTIEHYLELQKVRFAGKFNYRIHIADEIDADTLRIPPMLAQPFIENAIEHGIKYRETPGYIDIRFSLKDHILIFEVEDDGIGRQKAREIGIIRDPEHKSLATSLTRERLANLNRKLNEKIRLEIFDLKNALGEATGTRVTFGIPVGV
jgi:tetratricopeptide (TPR) repeat protein